VTLAQAATSAFESLAYLIRQPLFLAVTLGPLAIAFLLLLRALLGEERRKHPDGIPPRRIVAVVGRTLGIVTGFVLAYGLVELLRADPLRRALDEQREEHERVLRELDRLEEQRKALERFQLDPDAASRAIDAWSAAFVASPAAVASPTSTR
jgi:hypothetical protein